MRDDTDYKDGRLQAHGDFPAAWQAMHHALDSLDIFRQALVKWVWITMGALLFFSLLFLNIRGYSGLIAIIGTMGVGACALIAFTKWATYQSVFKKQFLSLGISKAYPGLYYRPDSHIPVRFYSQASLYPPGDKFNGEDLIQGVFQGVSMQFSEFESLKRRKSGKNVHYDRIFKGLFVQTKLPAPHQGWTIIGCRRAVKNPGTNYTAVIAQHGEFHKLFQVFTSNPQSAYDLLTPDVAEMLLHMRQAYGSQFRIAIFNQEIYGTFNMPTGFMEPLMWHRVTKKEIGRHFSSIETAVKFALDMQRVFSPAAAATTALGENPFSIAIGDDI